MVGTEVPTNSYSALVLFASRGQHDDDQISRHRCSEFLFDLASCTVPSHRQREINWCCCWFCSATGCPTGSGAGGGKTTSSTDG